MQNLQAEANPDKAAEVVAEWLKDGLPDRKSEGKKVVQDVLALHTVLANLHVLLLETDDIQKTGDV